MTYRFVDLLFLLFCQSTHRILTFALKALFLYPLAFALGSQGVSLLCCGSGAECTSLWKLSEVCGVRSLGEGRMCRRGCHWGVVVKQRREPVAYSCDSCDGVLVINCVDQHITFDVLRMLRRCEVGGG